jgi:hypothetical protein
VSQEQIFVSRKKGRKGGELRGCIDHSVISIKNLDCILFCAVHIFLGVRFSWFWSACLGLCSSGCLPSLLHSRSSRSLFWWFLFPGSHFLIDFSGCRCCPSLDFLLGALADFFVWHQVTFLSLLARYWFRSDFPRQFLSTGVKDFPSAEYFAAAVVLHTTVTAPAKRALVRSQASSFLRVSFCRSLLLLFHPTTPTLFSH